MKPTYVNYIFRSELRKVKAVLPDVLFYVTAQFPYVSETELFELRIVYNELLCNAVIHGNNEDSSKRVTLTIIPNSGKIVSIIRDEGTGFNYRKVLNEGFADPFCEHGRGLRIVKALTEYLGFNSLGNEIEFHKRIAHNKNIVHNQQSPVLMAASV